LDGERRGGRNDELKARYDALILADPDGKKGTRVAFIPRDTTFENCTPEMIAEARRVFGESMRVEGKNLVTVGEFTLTTGEAGNKLQPVAPATEATAAKPA
jgi:hypothetical protein